MSLYNLVVLFLAGNRIGLAANYTSAVSYDNDMTSVLFATIK